MIFIYLNRRSNNIRRHLFTAEPFCRADSCFSLLSICSDSWCGSHVCTPAWTLNFLGKTILTFIYRLAADRALSFSFGYLLGEDALGWSGGWLSDEEVYLLEEILRWMIWLLREGEEVTNLNRSKSTFREKEVHFKGISLWRLTDHESVVGQRQF